MNTYNKPQFKQIGAPNGRTNDVDTGSNADNSGDQPGSEQLTMCKQDNNLKSECKACGRKLVLPSKLGLCTHCMIVKNMTEPHHVVGTKEPTTRCSGHDKGESGATQPTTACSSLVSRLHLEFRESRSLLLPHEATELADLRLTPPTPLCSDVRVYRSDFVIDSTGESLFDYLLSQLRIPEEQREAIDSVIFNGEYTTDN